MDNNETNNVNTQENLGGQILMGDAPQTNFNQQPQTNLSQTMQPQNNLNQTMQPQNNLNLNETQQPISEGDDSIFSDMEPVTSPEVGMSSEQGMPSPKGKKPVGLIVLLFLVILGLGGYIAYDKFYNKEEVKETPTNTVEKVKEKKILIKDESQEIVYADIDEKHEGKIKRVPYINIDSKYADKINDEIDSMVKKGLDGQVADTAYAVDYKYYVNGEIVSVKFSWETEGSQTFSKIYNINQYTGEEVTNSEMLSQANITESDLNNKMVESYKTARPLESIEGNKDAPVKECYQKDIDTLTNGKIKGMYLADNNELCVLFEVNYVAGAGTGEAILNVTSNKVFLNPVTMQ